MAFADRGKARFKGRLIYKIANRVSRNPGAHTDRQKRTFIYKIGEPRKAAKSRLFTTLPVVNRGIRTLSSDDFYDPSLQAIVPFRPLRLVSHQILGSSPDGYLKALPARASTGSGFYTVLVANCVNQCHASQSVSAKQCRRLRPRSHGHARRNRAIEANNMRPVIDKVFPWTDAVAAIRYMHLISAATAFRCAPGCTAPRFQIE